jgi:hypothetical protein
MVRGILDTAPCAGNKYALLLDDHNADNKIITESPEFMIKVSMQFTMKISSKEAM